MRHGLNVRACVDVDVVRSNRRIWCGWIRGDFDDAGCEA
jgi:hypothetical protein